ncbi:MAG: DUF5667 domain-containing protein [Chloroflexota bacterium]
MAKPEDILERILRGELTREEAVRQQPEMHDRLLLLTDLAGNLRHLPRRRLDPDIRNAARMRLLRHIQETEHRSRWRRLVQRPTGLPAWALRTTAVIVAGSALTSGVSLASASALPTDTLYPVKRAVEQVQVAVAMGNEARANVYLGLADQRASEMAAVAGRIDSARLDLLAADYRNSLRDMSAAVQQMAVPPTQLLARVQTHVASQANELEARSIDASSQPGVQAALTGSEAVASHVVDQVVLVSEERQRPGRRDIHLAAVPAAAGATGGVATTTGKPAGTRAGQLMSPASPSNEGAPSPGQANPADVPYDRLWNQVAGAPFMAGNVRRAAEVGITQAKEDAKSGKRAAAIASLRAVDSRLREAVKTNLATEYTVNRIGSKIVALESALGASAAMPSPAGAPGQSSEPKARATFQARTLPALRPSLKASPAGSTEAMLYRRLQADIVSAPYMAPAVKKSLEHNVAVAAAASRAGRSAAASTQLNAAISAMNAAVRARQMTSYRAHGLVAHIHALLAAAPSPAARR